MMLITFKEIAHIPKKIHIFYDQAFDALFFKHDATKEAAFRRKMHSDLPIDEFKSCLAYFSIATYLKEKFSFLETNIKNELREAIALSKVDTNPEKFLTDLLESVCILQRDGLHLVFTHRSFQEYFAAFFISRGPASVGRLLDRICPRHNDIVLNLAYDMNSNLVEREWIWPRLECLIEVIERIDDKDIRSLIKSLYGDLKISQFGERLFLTTDASRKDNKSEQPPRVWPSFRRIYPDAFKGVFGSREAGEEHKILSAIMKAKKIKIKRGKSFGELVHVDAVEDEWLKQIPIWQYAVEIKKALLNLRDEVRKKVKNQEILVTSLLN